MDIAAVYRLARRLLALWIAATNTALTLAAVSFAVPYSGAQAAENAAPGVLILHSNQRPTPSQVIIDDTLRVVVPHELKRPVNLFSEYLDAEWTSLQTYGLAQAGFLRDKYGPRNISVIVADALPALRFEMEFRDRMFPGVPVVFLSVAVDRVDTTALPSDVVGVLEDYDPTPTLQLARRLHPDARRLVLVRGAGELDRLWDTRIRRALERLEGGLQTEYLSGLSTVEVLRHVGTLPPGTIVFTPGYFVDGAGEVSTPRASAERIAQASAVPVYGAYDTQIGAGIIGGHMSRFEDEGKQAGAIIVSLLNGAAPSEIPTSVAMRVPMVDWRQIRRWGVDERLLPADTVVRFREPSPWDKYWRELTVGLAILVVQAGLIAALLIQRRHRRMAEQAVQIHRTEVAHASRLAVAGELTASIAHEINQPLGAILANVDTADLLLQSGEDRRVLLLQILADIRRDDLRASEVIRRLRALLARHVVEQKPFDLNAAVTEVSALLRAEADRRRVTFELRLDAAAVMLGDRVQIQQVLINLLLNAMDAVGDVDEGRRTIVVTVENAEYRIMISVRDQGHGIAPEELPKIFGSFYSTKRAGMGLGLSIARTIVEAHGGRIWAESQLGEGTEFHMECPAIKPMTASSPAEAAT